ncbi:MAG TPA: hypothetical protein PK403_11770, partial [Plasticicumulans sp.]|nr:hypothetical protein [Plasticicumulans sp.]
MNLTASALLGVLEEAGTDVLTLAEGLGEDELLNSRITRTEIRRLLLRMAQTAANLPPALRTRVPEIDWDGWAALAIALNGSEAEVCDGLWHGVRSQVRSLLFGPEQVRFTGFVAWRGLVPMDRVPIEAMDPPSQVWIGPGHMINRYPVRGGQLLNFVAFAERSGWEDEGWSIPATVGELAAEFVDWHPWVTQVIAAVPEKDLFKWALCARSAL